MFPNIRPDHGPVPAPAGRFGGSQVTSRDDGICPSPLTGPIEALAGAPLQFPLDHTWKFSPFHGVAAVVGDAEDESKANVVVMDDALMVLDGPVCEFNFPVTAS